MKWPLKAFQSKTEIKGKFPSILISEYRDKSFMPFEEFGFLYAKIEEMISNLFIRDIHIEANGGGASRLGRINHVLEALVFRSQSAPAGMENVQECLRIKL